MAPKDEAKPKSCCSECGALTCRYAWIGIVLLFTFTLAATIFLGHLSIILFVFITAIVLGEAIPSQMNSASITDTATGLGYKCDSNFLNQCIYKYLINVH